MFDLTPESVKAVAILDGAGQLPSEYKEDILMYQAS